MDGKAAMRWIQTAFPILMWGTLFFATIGRAPSTRGGARFIPGRWGFSWALPNPPARYEFPVAQIFNFAIFVVALLAFRFFLHELIGFCEEPPDGFRARGRSLPALAIVLLGYPLFLWVALEVDPLWCVTPDLAVVACVCLTAAMLLQCDEILDPESLQFLASCSESDTGQKRFCFLWDLWLWRPASIGGGGARRGGDSGFCLPSRHL